MVNQKLSYSPETFPSDASLQMKYSVIHINDTWLQMLSIHQRIKTSICLQM